MYDDFQPLAGIRVLDLSRLLPGPYCTLLLSMLGAEVIKVEAPGVGDYARFMPPMAGAMGALFQAVNRGKRSLIVDLKRPEGAELLLSLLPDFDVVVDGFRPGVMDRLGLSDDRMVTAQPRLIRVGISGWGQDSPLSHSACHDMNFAALAGLLHANGNRQGPALPGSQFGDIGGGALFPVMGILGALLERERTGRGRRFDIAMADGIAAMCLTTQLLDHGFSPSAGPLTGGLANYNIYRCRDGHPLAVAALEPKFWTALAQRLELTDLLALPPLPGPAHEAAIERVAAVLATRPRAAWLELLADLDVCVSPVLAPQEVAKHPHHVARGRVVELDSGLAFVAPPLGRLDLAPAPSHGEHSDAILTERGLSQARIAALRTAGVIQ